MATVDVTVMGAGIFGLSVAWACAARGARVRVIDPDGPGAGASGGLVGALAPHAPEAWTETKAFQLESLLAAGAFWRAVAEAGGGDPGHARTGRLQPVPDAAALARARERIGCAKALWGDAAEWEVVQATGSWAPASATGWLVRDTLSARLHPRRALAALVAALTAAGGAVLTAGEARGAVVWATGVRGLDALSRDVGAPVGAAVKGQAATLGFDAGPDAPQIYAPGLHVVPHADGTVAVGSTAEREFAPGSETTTDERLDTVIEAARAAVPALAGAPVLERWAGLRPRARSRAPMLGPWPGRPGHFVANGGFKIGFGMAPGVAAAMADLVLEGRRSYPEAFDVAASLTSSASARSASINS